MKPPRVLAKPHRQDGSLVVLGCQCPKWLDKLVNPLPDGGSAPVHQSPDSPGWWRAVATREAVDEALQERGFVILWSEVWRRPGFKPPRPVEYRPTSRIPG